jgi:hypothetical protein
MNKGTHVYRYHLTKKTKGRKSHETVPLIIMTLAPTGPIDLKNKPEELLSLYRYLTKNLFAIFMEKYPW